MFEDVIQKIDERPETGPAVRQAVEEDRPLLLNVHAHEGTSGYCLSLLARSAPGNELQAFPSETPVELAHICSFGASESEALPRTSIFARELGAYYRLEREPELYVEGRAAAGSGTTGTDPREEGKAVESDAAERSGTPSSHLGVRPQGELAQPPLYDPEMVRPMREEVVRLGATELKTPAEVDAALEERGSTLVFVNSVCGCSAAVARPALALSLAHERAPDRLVTVFAGMEREAVARARGYFQPHPPSSPQIALLVDGELVAIWQRHEIEGREAPEIAASLQGAFDTYCRASSGQR
jgi:putative YphP/YqiW family bacilliredoxin